MKQITIILMALISGSAFSKTACNGQTNVELTACAQANYKSADAILNKTYSDTLGKINSTDKQNLISAQRAWVAYKDKYCNSAFDATSPGAEASIDKWSCLTSVTESRTSEIRYISSSIGMDEFRRSLGVMANLYEGGDTAKVIMKLERNTPDGSNPGWLKYVSLNCKITAVKLQEDRETCAARLNFYKNW
ncbi:MULTISPECIES: lysozyme inhibitor LprI family protein [Burkholderia cepacia complex]|uniref:lysozyme inhibitor LprI family protein n=1 Tax=Burkholderia cepacia complex TaxID=87882 RepID=UPI000F078B4F|nr:MULTISPECIES: lysozyme inhibitor LprI family protein [Burkholderia cepacia complex]AYQ42069.1 hypothetical protein CVS37_29815 [Burkholderia lata]